MSHASRVDLAERFGAAELDDLAPAGAGGASRADAALADAAAEIDAALSREFDLPLPAGPWPQLKAIQCDVARAALYDDAVPKAVKAAAAEARDGLARIASGADRLVDANGVPAPRRARASFDGGAPLMRRASLRGA